MREERPLFDNSGFTPSLMFEYINTCTNNKHVTYSEFKGFTKINITEYVMILNFTDTYDIDISFVNFEDFKLFLLKKRFE